MSRALNMQVMIGENNDGKRRIVTSIFKDEVLEVSFALHADEAEEWAKKLLEIAQEVRGRAVILPS